MVGANRRSSERVPFRAPVLVTTSRGPVGAEIRDMSRQGLRFRIRASLLGIVVNDEFGAVVEELHKAIGARPSLSLHYEMLGPLIGRRSTVCRVIVPSDVPDSIDVGCSFDTPLSSDETIMLGVALMPERGAADNALPRADAPAPHVLERGFDEPEQVVVRTAPKPTPQPEPTQSPPDESVEDVVDAVAEPMPVTAKPVTPARPASSVSYRNNEVKGASQQVRYRAYVTGSDGASLRCQAESIAHEWVVIRMRQSSLVAVGPEGRELAVTRMASSFTQQFGDRVRLKLTEGAKHLWTGPARVRGIDLPRDRPKDLIVTLGFARPLRPAELTRLGLV